MNDRSQSLKAIVVDDLCKSYGGRMAVTGLSFDVAAGEVLGILGPNGAGKTTTIEILEGYRRADSGSVRVLGHDPAKAPLALRRSIGVMLQDGGVSPSSRVGDLIALYHSFYPEGMPLKEAIALSGLDGNPRQYVRRLSGGQRQRLSLVLALMGRPEVLFLDEPTAGMDPHARDETLDLVRSAADAGAAVILSTHLLDEAEAICDRILIMDRGHCVTIDTPQALVRAGEGRHIHLRTRQPVDTAELAERLMLEAEACELREDGDLLIAVLPTIEQILRVVTFLAEKHIELLSLETGSRRLEDVFLELTGGE